MQSNHTNRYITGGSTPTWKKSANLAAGHQIYKPQARKGVMHDRFIPLHASMNTDIAELKISFTASTADHMKSVTNYGRNTTYSDYVAAALFGEKINYSKQGNIENRVLNFKPKVQRVVTNPYDVSEILFGEEYKNYRRVPERTIETKPQKTLDAPGLSQNYYLNVLDWSEKNILAVTLENVVYLWNASSGQIEALCETTQPEEYVSSLRWSSNGDTLAVGHNHGQVKLYDVRTFECIRTISSHIQRVGCLSWNGAIVSSGSCDSEIHNHDIRLRNHVTAKLLGHEQEVCGLSWSPNGRHLASGGNDNLVHIWSPSRQLTSRWAPKYRFDRHKAAVKALAWCPWKSNLLATGGGSDDKLLCFWNTQFGKFKDGIDTESQVTSIVWNPHEREIATTHSYCDNELKLWKYPSLQKVIELTGHSDRILHTAINPEGTIVVTGANDETLRFWELFETQEARRRRLGLRTRSSREPFASFRRNLEIR